MGRYIEWDDVVNRYPEINNLGGSDEISSSYIVYAEGMVDGLLADFYTTPFSSNNITVRDLCIDCVYWRAGRFKLDDAAAVQSEFYAYIDRLKSREMQMIDTSGTVLSIGISNAPIYTNVQSYHSFFGVDDPIEWMTDEDWLEDQADERD